MAGVAPASGRLGLLSAAVNLPSLTGDVDGYERPFVVVTAAVVHPQRPICTRADNADDPAARGSCWRWRLPACAYSRGYLPHLRIQRLKVPPGDRILVAASQKPLLHQHVDVWGKGAGVATLEQPDRLNILLAPEDEFGLTFAPNSGMPYGEGDTEQHRQDAYSNDQCCHGVAMRARVVVCG